ncbi:MAG: ATP-grasp domain-containing protein [Microthrixaceae bacterium]|nr:ATP-grasp domain-containing protein [Microthrixaceae bacterium]
MVLVLPTETYRAADFIAAAAEVGVEVVVATEHRPPLATEMESRLVVVDLDRPEEAAARIAAMGDRAPIDAVVGVDDQGVLTAAHAGEILGLAHNPPDAVAATRDKAQMRGVLASWGVRQPDFRVLVPGADVAEAAAAVGCPCVLKPLSLSASTGVIRADTPADAVVVAERIRRILADHGRSPDEALLIERFVPGAEVSLEALLHDGDLQVLALFDKPDPLDGPYFEETIYVTPSRLGGPEQTAVLAAAAEACRALGLRDGPVHAELRVGPGADGEVAAWVLEVAARSIGGLCSRVLRFGTGISLEQLIVEHAVGRDVADSGRTDGAAGVMMLPIPRSGVLTGVDGLDAARGVEGVTGVEITATIGRRIDALPDGGRYLGFVFARGDTPDSVESALRRAHSELTVAIVDEPRSVDGRTPA